MVTDLVGQDSLIDSTSELIITDTDWHILFRNSVLDFRDGQWDQWVQLYKEESVSEKGLSWEVADKTTGKYYNVHTFAAKTDGKTSLIHHVYDVSEYAGLVRDLSSYSSEWRILASCQDELIQNLSDDPCNSLFVAVKYFDVSHAVLFLDVGGELWRYVLEKEGDTPSFAEVKDVEYSFAPGEQVTLPDLPEKTYMCCCSGRAVSIVGYAMFVPIPDEKEKRLHSMLFNEFKLYIEHALLQKQIIYENEHDHATGLYNKGKLNELVSSSFRNAESIAVFNMDVNYLKRVNDTIGHEAGNSLIRKAAESIKAISNDRVFGFRVGGDEFLVVAMNVTDQDTEELLRVWRRKLTELNEDKETPECIIACGLCRQYAPYDLEKIMEEADKRMYQDKRRIKIARGEDPDQR